MKVGELLEALQGVDASAKVILQRDAEGNSYSPLWGIDAAAVYVPIQEEKDDRRVGADQVYQSLGSTTR